MADRKNEYRHDGDGRTVHDVGGMDFGKVDMHDHDLALWERRVDAMIVLLNNKKGIFKTDAMRRVIESYGEQQYDATTYYEKWVRALRNLLVEQDVIGEQELAAKIAETREKMQAEGRAVEPGDVPWNEGLARS